MVAALHLYKITLLSNTINNKTTFSFTPPQNHTTLKPYRTCSCAACCFTSPQNYTTFKPIQDMANAPLSLCTPTKLHYSQTLTGLNLSPTKALYPYKITLLSNLKYLRKTAYEPFVQFCKNICYIFNMVVFELKRDTNVSGISFCGLLILHFHF